MGLDLGPAEAHPSVMRVLHCSDVHVTQDYFSGNPLRFGARRMLALLELSVGGRARRYAHAGETLQRIAHDAKAQAVDHVVLSGDLTAYATEVEFDGARKALGELAEDPSRFSVIPGNHDVYTAGATRSRRFERYFGHLLRSDLPEHAREDGYPFVRLVGDEVAVVGLCSARLAPVPGLSFGRIGARQLEGVRAIVEDPRLAHRAVLVAVHHAPLTHHGRKDKLYHRLVDAEALFSLLEGPRFAVLHGHIHQRYHHPANASHPHVFGAGSSTELGHEGYWIIDVRDGRVSGGTKYLPGGQRAA